MVVYNKEVKEQNAGEGAVRKILAYDKNLMTVELRFEKGAVGAKHSHPHEQIGYVIEGSLIYQEEGSEDQVLHAGDTYYVAPNRVHGIVCLEPVKLLDIFTPMREDFVKSGD